MKATKSLPFVQEMGERNTSFGRVLYIKVRTEDYRELSWREIWDTFSGRYPTRWAFQMFPPAEELVDEVPCYHLWVLEEPPRGVNIRCR